MQLQLGYTNVSSDSFRFKSLASFSQIYAYAITQYNVPCPVKG